MSKKLGVMRKVARESFEWQSKKEAKFKICGGFNECVKKRDLALRPVIWKIQ